jgi:hypothetical protein
MPDTDDWRLTNETSFLQGASLCYQSYKKSDHDHCAFCWAKFMDEQNISAPPGCLHEGYATLAFDQCDDDYNWICPTCFNDFKEQFEWKLATET